MLAWLKDGGGPVGHTQTGNCGGCRLDVSLKSPQTTPQKHMEYHKGPFQYDL